ncbi:Hypothetical protein A7982_01642 [Minicystis rosea]|nr:Hypothetical protein A7982_01642 [Minicystis rosea]
MMQSFNAPSSPSQRHARWMILLGAALLAVPACSASTASTTGSGGSSGTGFGGATSSSSSSGKGGAGGMDIGIGGSIGIGSGTGGSPEVPMTDVEVVITADNAYSFGYGDAKGITHFTQGTRAQTAGQIFNCGEGPETYVIPAADAPPTAYLYIVTWDDLSVTQGVLGQFLRTGGTPLYTGDPKFEVCATGINLSSSQTGPSQADINVQIGICNDGTGDPATTSAGWVNGAGAMTNNAVGTLAVGEANDPTPGGTFPPTCPTGDTPTPGSIDPAARWMWYNPGGVTDAFHSTGSNTFRAYLIFRLAAQNIPIPPPK